MVSFICVLLALQTVNPSDTDAISKSPCPQSGNISTPSFASTSDEVSSPRQTAGSSSRSSPLLTSPGLSTWSSFQSPIVDKHAKHNVSGDAKADQRYEQGILEMSRFDECDPECYKDIMAYYKSRIHDFGKFNEFSKMRSLAKTMMQQKIKPDIAVWNEFFSVWMSSNHKNKAIDTQFWHFISDMWIGGSPPTVETFNIILAGLAIHRKGELMDYVIEMMPSHRVIPDSRSYSIASLMEIYLQPVTYIQATDALLYIQNGHSLTGGHFILKNYIAFLAHATVEDYNQIIGQNQMRYPLFLSLLSHRAIALFLICSLFLFPQHSSMRHYHGQIKRAHPLHRNYSFKPCRDTV